ncbi:hypothetical protein OG897_36495 [Streptomyces sp. NBC_00237]|uniref:hypothetical protein n=1 Tax=Streptomyces sp. NBC_00237 TaxID=2975687 RepID=UPI0022563DE4|nr:hypothetical protein [Streptomyces sp. NBC_00237]MCX5206888.1 hypothetical protein [Streptomyces sp. NBC_00237]
MAMAMLVAVVLGLGAGACSENAPRVEGVSSSKEGKGAAGKASDPPSGTEQAAIAAYRAMWVDAAEASRTSDAKHPQLDDHAQGDALGLLRDMMEEAKADGATSRGGVRVAPSVVKSQSAEVELLDCVDGTQWKQVKAGGSSDALEGAHYRAEATVAQGAGVWKVSKLYWGEAGSCTE